MVEFGFPDLLIKREEDIPADSEVLEIVRVPLLSGSKSLMGMLGNMLYANADALVIPANPGFDFSNFGLQGIIADAAGIEVFEEANKQAQEYLKSEDAIAYSPARTGLPLGYTIATSPGRLNSFKYLIHVNTRRYISEEEGTDTDAEAIRVATRKALELSHVMNFRSITFPALGTGIARMRLPDSIRSSVLGINDFFEDLNGVSTTLEKIQFVAYFTQTMRNALGLQGMIQEGIMPPSAVIDSKRHTSYIPA